MKKLACIIAFFTLGVPAKAQLPTEKIEQVIGDVGEGRWPAFIDIALVGGPSFSITTPAWKIAIAAAEAIEEDHPFTPADVTPDMLTLDIEVTPPAKSSEAELEAEALEPYRGPLSYCVALPLYPDAVDILNAVVVAQDGSPVAIIAMKPTEPLDVQVARNRGVDTKPSGDYGRGLIVTIPLDPVAQRATLRVFLSTGGSRDIELDPSWLR